MNLSKLLEKVEASFGFARDEQVDAAPAFYGSDAATSSVGDVMVATKGAANDLAEAHNDAYRPHIVDRREARRLRREIRTA